MTERVLVIVSIDTEEDNWDRAREGVTLDNIAELRPQAAFFRRLGVRPTYFTAYQVAMDARAADVVREVCDGGAGEIGGHLHPWNTPPLSEAFVPRNSMLKNLPADLQQAKIERLTNALERAFGGKPNSFRAGRYGLGRDTVPALLRSGYRVDSSVSPSVSLEPTDDGPNFEHAPFVPYRIAPGQDVTRPAPHGDLLEIPLSYGFSRGPFGFWGAARRLLEAAPFSALHLAGIAHRCGIVRRLALCPEFATVAEMLTLSRRLLEQGVRHLQLAWHSPTLKPGLSPFAATAGDVARMLGTVERYFEGLERIAPLKFVTISEAAAALG